ncbi:MAG: GNAT family N-acetyltransferase [Gammaproteobacteria bacterium]|nr:MAG: GNAT family N-acetyltransferase [Gammaproteobacteria bacterium]
MTIEIPLPKHFDKFFIRNWIAEDAQQLADIEFDPEVKQHLKLPTISKNEFIDRFQPRGWAIVANQGNIVAGAIDINKFELNPKKLELRILLAKEYRTRGFATEATRFFISCIFGAPWTEGVVAVIHPQNLASIALFKKLNFIHTSAITAERHVYELSRT